MDSENDEYLKSENFKELRAKQLGFKPQSELFCNSFLPYGTTEILDKESHEVFSYIKLNLGITIAHREVYNSMVLVTKLLK